MSVIITSYPKRDYLLIESKGILQTAEELLTQSQMVHAEIIKYDYNKILVNEPETVLPLDLTPYFNLVKKYAESKQPEVRKVKIVVVVSEKYKEVVSSWETICHSMGFRFYLFTSFSEAEDFLLNDRAEDL